VTATTSRPALGAPPLRPVPLLAADPALADGLTDAERAAARTRVVVGAASLPAGEWAPPADRPEGALALLVVRGIALRQVRLAGRLQAQLVGAGDVLDPWSPVTQELSAAPESWRIVQPVAVAVLDEAAVTAAGAFPALGLALVRRLVDRGEQLAALAAVTQLPRVDLRLLAVMWHLAHRWGRVGPEGVLLDLPLTHEVIGHLVGARRPSITLALRQLDEAGLLRRRSGDATREWVLRPDAGTVLHGDGTALDDEYAAAARGGG